MTMISDSTTATSRNVAGFTGTDPRRRRFMLNPGLYLCENFNARETGQQGLLLPDGLITFRSDHIAGDNFDIYVAEGQTYDKTVIKEYTAAWFVANVKTRYENIGVREIPSLTNLEDATDQKSFPDSAQGYFNAVYPALAEMGIQCPQELTNCVTCRLALLGRSEEQMSEALRERILNTPDPVLAFQVAAEAREANLAYEEWCRRRWSDLTSEIQKRRAGEPGIAHIDDAGHHVRKHLHEARPEDESAMTAAGYGAAVGEAQRKGFEQMAEAFREGKNTVSDEVLKGIVETQRQQGEVLGKLVELIGKKEPKKKVEKDTE